MVEAIISETQTLVDSMGLVDSWTNGEGLSVMKQLCSLQ